jgi:cytochrome P450
MTKTIDDLPTIAAPEEFVPILAGGPLVSQPSFIARMAMEHGPVFKRDLRDGGRFVYMVGPEANRFVLFSHRDYFSHAQGWTPALGPFFGTGLLNMDGQEWATHRRMMNPAFTAAYMAVYLPVMHRVIARRSDPWAERGEVDLYAEAREIAFDVAAEALVGFTTGAEVDRLRDLFYALLHPNYDPQTESELQFEARMAQVEAELAELLLPMVQTRRAAAANQAASDVLGMMVHARDEHGAALSDAQLVDHVKILLVAGHETTTTLASWLLYLLCTHSEHLARARAEMAQVLGDSGLGSEPPSLEQLRALRFLGYASAEAGRLQSPVRMAPRGVVKPFEFGGYLIPEGTRIRYAIAAGHRLPHIFPDPERFDPDRFAPPREEDRKQPYALVTFGGGPRVCIGMNMAQVEVKALAARVLRRYDLTPVEGHPVVQVGFITGFPAHGIKVKVSPHTTR